MTDLDDRQACFDYLLENLSRPERARFERRLASDPALEAELKRCESDLADFAEASVRATPPPERVWHAVQAEMRGASEPVPLGRPPRSSSWLRINWPIAAALLLGLNAWQFGRLAELGAIRSEGARVAAAAGPAAALPAEGARPAEEGSAGDGVAPHESARVPEEQYEALLRERDQLAERVENLEVNYLGLVEVAESLMSESLLGDPHFTERAIELLAQKDGSRMVVSGGLWERIALRRGDKPLAVLSSSKAAPTYSYNLWTVGNTYHVQKVLEESPPAEPYALAFVDPISQQAIFSFGNLPGLAETDEMVLWIRDEAAGRFAPVGELPRLEAGAASNIAARIPDGFEASSDFLLSVESGGVEGKSAPGERVVLRTASER